MRVFLDTNVIASAVATRGICADALRVILAEHELIIGEHVLTELRLVLERKFRVSPDLVRETDEFLRGEASVIDEASPLDVPVRDPDDLRVLEEAVAGGADVLVTGDRDLLDLPVAPPLPIVSPRGFWNLLRDESPGEK